MPGFSFLNKPLRQTSVVQLKSGYTLVRLRNGTFSVRSVADDETFHPGIGPAAEAEALYVRQLKIPQRAVQTEGEFVIWDVGLGAAANALTALSSLLENPLEKPARIRLVSFDQTTAAAKFALRHSLELGYLAGFESTLEKLIEGRCARFEKGATEIIWQLELGDFPSWLANSKMTATSPQAILFDPHSPQKNPAMWTVKIFSGLFRQLDPRRPCALANFTRSTMARAAMLLGGFFVGVGRPSGLKDETTVATNVLAMLDEPLDRRWLERAVRSDSAEPLREPVYRRAKLSAETLEQLRRHPQFG